MKQGSTLLKVVSIIMIVYGIILAVFGLLSTVGGGAMIGADVETDVTAHKAAFAIGVIGVVFSAITLIQSFGGDGASIGSSLVGLILPVLYLVGVYQTRQGA